MLKSWMAGAMVVGVMASMVGIQAAAQTPSGPAEALSMSEMLQKSKPLVAEAVAKGSSGITLAKYPEHYTMLTVRTKSGGGEQHAHFADFLFVVDGEGTEMTGGTMVEGKDTGEGEMRGKTLEGATPHVLKKGDWIHIPAGTPHQAVMAPGKMLTLYVVKIEESKP